MIDFVTEHDHGILVVEQLGSTAIHDDWDVYAQPAHDQGDSLYIAVLPTMEGTVSTSVRKDDEPMPSEPPSHLVYEGHLSVPSGVLLIGDSDRNIEIRLPVLKRAIHLTVFVDHAGLASQVLVRWSEADA